MKSQVLFLLLAFAFIGFACNPSQEEGETSGESEEMEEAVTTGEDTAPEPKTVASTESYTTVILEDGIASPRKEMKGNIGDVAVTVNYGSPSVKERKIWGELIPFGELWRTGANAGTTIEFSTDVLVEGKALPAGKYSVFTIPSADKVVVIFNKEIEHRGTGEYSEAEDALRVTVTPQAKEESQEAMEFMVDGDAVVLRWEKWAVPFKVAAKG